MDQQTPLVSNPANGSGQPVTSKHFKSFWPIVIIATLSAIIGGLVVWAAYNAGLDEELNSLLPGADRRSAKIIEPMISQADESINEWKTYRNDQYGFEIKYPSSLKFSTTASFDSPVFIFDNNKGFPDILSVNICPIGCGEGSEDAKMLKESKDLLIGGQLFKFSKAEAGNVLIYLINTQGSKFLSLNEKNLQASGKIQAYIGNSVENENLFNQMLSTFKLIK